MTPARVVFMGSPSFAVPSLQAVAARCAVPLVVTQPDRPAGRGRHLEPTAIRSAAQALGLEVFTYERGHRGELESRIVALSPDLLVVVAFGHILKPSTLDLARRGALNVHASLLPRWRGVAPVERAILAGDTETGVSIMRIDAGIDTGPVLARASEPIRPSDDRVTLAHRLAALGAATLLPALEAYLESDLHPAPQPEEGACYAPRLEKSEGRMDWHRGATELANQVRGLYEWPGAFTTLEGELLKVHRAEPDAAPGPPQPGQLFEAEPRGGVWVACGTGRLRLLEVQLAGKPRVEPEALVRGRVLRVGMQLGR